MNAPFLSKMMKEDRGLIKMWLRKGKIHPFSSCLCSRQDEYLAAIKEHLPQHCTLKVRRTPGYQPFPCRFSIIYKEIDLLLVDASRIFNLSYKVAYSNLPIVKEEEINTLLYHDIPLSILMSKKRNIFLI